MRVEQQAGHNENPKCRDEKEQEAFARDQETNREHEVEEHFVVEAPARHEHGPNLIRKGCAVGWNEQQRLRH